MMDDEQLLHAYARERSESAFGELVARHIDFVYSTALRVVNGDSHLAQSSQAGSTHPAQPGKNFRPLQRFLFGFGLGCPYMGRWTQ